MAKKYNKIVLAYSGGLDTSVLIPWLKENYGCEVIAVSADVGQGAELDGLEEKALKTGASKLYIEDLKKEFVDEYIIPTMKAGATYEHYLLGTSFARPIIAKRIVEIAKKEGADAICHGCTGKGNDQVRFELAIKAFAPQMDVIAPWRFWELNSRELEPVLASCRGLGLTSELIIYGNAPMMVSAQCITNTVKGCTHKRGTLMMKDRTGAVLPVKNHCSFCYNTIYNPAPLSLLGSEKLVRRLMAERLRLQFTVEGTEQTEKVLDAFIGSFVYGRDVEAPFRDFTRGHFKRGVE